jgi:phosphocarrier protein HPr
MNGSVTKDLNVNTAPKNAPLIDLDRGVKRTFILENRLGLHARPSALMVKTLRNFDCQVAVESGGETANAKSILGLLSLAAGFGSSLTFTAIGDDASKALEEVAKLFSTRFEEAY